MQKDRREREASRSKHHVLGFVSVLALLVGFVAGIPVSSDASSGRDGAFNGDQGEVVFSLPVGKPIDYVTGPELLTWGPAGFAVDDDGGVWIADGAAHRVMRFDRSGAVNLVVDVESDVVGIGDIAVHGNDLVVLDFAAVEPRVYVYDRETGRRTNDFAVPLSVGLDHGLTGVAVLADGIIAVELEAGLRVVPVGALGNGSLSIDSTPSSVRETSIGSVGIEPAFTDSERTERVIRINGEPVDLVAENPLVTVMVAGASFQSAFLLVDEVGQAADGTILVDTTVRAVDPEGRFVGTARVPRMEAVVQLFNPVAVTSDGEILALVPKASTIDVVRLTLADTIQPVLPSSAFVPEDGGISTQSCLSRSTMWNIAQEFRWATAWLNNTNINGACSGRTKPRYLGGAGDYASVPYKWGGWNTVAQYRGNMDPKTGKAGDINTSSGTLSCAYGVDCSGYVSRVWRLSSKHSTSTLPNVTHAIAVSSLLNMDLFNKAGSHAMLYRSASGNGYNVAESTTASSLDRVVFRTVTGAYASGFTTRRFNNVC